MLRSREFLVGFAKLRDGITVGLNTTRRMFAKEIVDRVSYS